MSGSSSSPTTIEDFTADQVAAIVWLEALIDAVKSPWTSPEHYKRVLEAAQGTEDVDLIDIATRGDVVASCGLVAFEAIKDEMGIRLKIIRKQKSEEDTGSE